MDLDPGWYCIAAGANGYAKQSYGQKNSVGSGNPVEVTAGRTIRNISLPLVPAGSISGRVRDNSGQPVTGILVQVLKSSYNVNGQRTFVASGTARTDDRGEYRVYWITPGRYYVWAGMVLPGIIGSNVGSPNEIAGDSFLPMFYPSAMDTAQATRLDVKPAGDINGVDFIFARQPLFRIRGRVVDGRGGALPSNVNITLITFSPTGGTSSNTSPQSFNPQDGTFELRDVSPGPHVVRAQISMGSNSVTPANGGVVTNLVAMSGTGQVALNVMSDVNGLVLAIVNPGPISGRITMEGPAENPGLDRMRVQLQPSIDGVVTYYIGGPSPVTQATSADGVFRIDTVLPGEYRLAMATMPPDAYTKQARFNQNDVLNKPLQLSPSESGTLEVVVSSRGGRINGVVLDERQQPVRTIQAVLVPDRNRDRTDLYKTAMTDSSGNFSMRGIAPGDYRVFAWEAIDPYFYFDPEQMKDDETKGKPVHISESSNETVDVRLIPAQ